MVEPPRRASPLVVVTGVSGSGKSTVGEALAGRLGVAYADADAFHPASNIEKMAAGHSLDDDDRAPWLAAIAGWLGAHQDVGAVVTCSALRRRYRDVLRDGADGVRILHLDGDAAVISERVNSRKGHFMPPALLDSQLQTLEPLDPDEAGVAIDLTLPVDQIVGRFVATLGPLTDAPATDAPAT